MFPNRTETASRGQATVIRTSTCDIEPHHFHEKYFVNCYRIEIK